MSLGESRGRTMLRDAVHASSCSAVGRAVGASHETIRKLLSGCTSEPSLPLAFALEAKLSIPAIAWLEADVEDCKDSCNASEQAPVIRTPHQGGGSKETPMATPQSTEPNTLPPAEISIPRPAPTSNSYHEIAQKSVREAETNAAEYSRVHREPAGVEKPLFPNRPPDAGRFGTTVPKRDGGQAA